MCAPCEMKKNFAIENFGNFQKFAIFVQFINKNPNKLSKIHAIFRQFSCFFFNEKFA